MITLKHLDEFKKVLSDYRMSDEAKRALTKNPLVILTGITGGGRNTIIAELVKTGNYHFVVSDTTRPPRQNNGVLEQDGGPYWFRTEEEVLDDVRAGAYVAPAIIHSQQVSGMSNREIVAAHTKGLTAISEIEAQGTDETLRQAPGTLIPIFVLPPSYQEWMRRWATRGSMSDDEKQNRLASARSELTMALNTNYYHFHINDDLAKAVSGVQKIVAGQIDPEHEVAGRKLAQEILQKIS